MTSNLGFSRAQKLARASDIEFVKRTGKRVKTGLLDVRVATSPSSCTSSKDPCARVGVIVPKYKRSIVERNKLRRRLREIVRTRMLPVIPARDVFIRAMPQAYTSSFDVLVREIDGVIARIA
ncbi:MAG: ribonuclease P protein component [Gemmatimonadaceae bacterium]